ncbi:MAG: hypothetical protein LBU62_01410 [Bacteroidales bacterium]|jgi:hypothetical protein|nr:hypothetical protein [Bacteroidales bacterium]
MTKFKYLFSWAVVLAIASGFSSCGDDDPEPVKLIPAFVTVASGDQVQDLQGDATSKDISVQANREIKVTVPVAATWLTATVKSADLTAGTAVVTFSVTDNTEAFKGRTATIDIQCVATPGRDDDNVNSASAKGTITVTQSLKGLAVADVFDLKWKTDGTPYDASANGIAIEKGPLAPIYAANGIYGLPTVTIPQVDSKAYATGTPPEDNGTAGRLYEIAIWERNKAAYGDQFAAIADVTYWDHNGGEWSTSESKTMGDGKKMCYYKVQWGGKPATPSAGGASVVANDNKAFVDAYNTAFSYELLFRAPNQIASDPPSIGGSALFGNANMTHCGFGINIRDGAIVFLTHTGFGNTMVVGWQDSGTGVVGVPVEEKVVPVENQVYHVVATFNKAEGSAKLYVDGVLIASVTDNADFKTHGIMFPTDYYGATNGQHAHDRRTWNTEWLCLGNSCHQSGMPNWAGPDRAEYAVARVYGKALTQEEVTASYNYFKPE